MSLAHLQRRYLADEAPDFIDDDIDQHNSGSRRANISRVVYYDPEREDPLTLTIARELLSSSRSPYRTIRFEALTETDLRLWSPFRNRADEKSYMMAGHSQGLDTLMPGVWPDKPAKRARGRREYHLAIEQSVDALQKMVCVAEASFLAAERLGRGRPRPQWSRMQAQEFLAPVCGRQSGIRGCDDPGAIIPLIRKDELLVGCESVMPGDMVYPAWPMTPNTALMRGRSGISAWFRLSRPALDKRMKAELGEPGKYFGQEFDAHAATIWLCQIVMGMRIATEEMWRSLSEERFLEGEHVRFISQSNQALKNKLGLPKNTQIAQQKWDLTRRMLVAFFGGVLPPRGNGRSAVCDSAEQLARWLGLLRRSGAAIIGLEISQAFQTLVDGNLADDPFWMDVNDLLAAMLPQQAWQDMSEAIYLVGTRKCESVNVRYKYMEPDEEPISVLNSTGRQLEITGPFLMLPLSVADYWTEQARSLTERGLYAA
ncbi:hypothetical protein ACIKT0_00030 [Hansschlegelia beijingensis]|uniref:hypothetical protein n=1 Tax=Hansschlegelia beijingensis TaxID=1133344 RepID=UPI00387F30E6